jgi:cytoskeletal protein CcmA (bactofilin family)
MEKKPEETNQSSSLESPDSAQPAVDDVNALEGTTDALADSDAKKAQTTAPKQGIGKKIQGLIVHVNVYVLLFLLIIVLAAGFVLIGVQRNKKANSPTTINTQTLTAEELRKLSESEQKIGDPKSILSIESNAIFSGKVLVRDSLDVAGTIKVGGALSLPGISVSGASTFDQVTANNLSITGNTTIQGQLNIQKGITSSGGASFGGPISAPQLTVQSLQLSGDLTISRHIDAAGGTPGKINGSSLGAGGTAAVSGTDTAGTVNINTGGGAGSGCFVTISFTNRFSSTPHVVITPIGSAAASLNYYINRSSSSFSICTASTPPSGQSFAFDYIAID